MKKLTLAALWTLSFSTIVFAANTQNTQNTKNPKMGTETETGVVDESVNPMTGTVTKTQEYTDQVKEGTKQAEVDVKSQTKKFKSGATESQTDITTETPPNS